MQIFAGFAGEGASNESEVVENGDFRFFRSLSSEHYIGLHGHTTAFACFWAPFFLGGGAPEFLDLHYKIQPVSDHVARFTAIKNAWRKKKGNFCGKTYFQLC